MIAYNSGRKMPKKPCIWTNCKPLDFAPHAEEYQRTLPIKAAETIAAFWHAIIPDKYCEYLNTTAVLPEDGRATMKRTQVYNLAGPKGRREFVKGLVSLLLYVKSFIER